MGAARGPAAAEAPGAVRIPQRDVAVAKRPGADAAGAGGEAGAAPGAGERLSDQGRADAVLAGIGGYAGRPRTGAGADGRVVARRGRVAGGGR